MPRKRVSVFLAASLLLGTLGGLGLMACRSGSRPLEPRLQAALDARVRRCGVKGASVAVVLPDGTLWQGASGLSHGEVEMGPEMAFAIGSITKNMVAALVLELAEEGKLSLDDPISRWLPAYPHVSGHITIRQMLNHTSGLFMFWDNQALWDDLIRYRTRVFTPEEVLGYLEEPYFAPGEGHHYSNTNYLLAAMIITRVADSTLAEQMRQRFWEPLGLASARLPLEEPYPESMAHVWGDNFEKGGAFRDITLLPRASHDSITYGSAGVFMTPGDLALWAHALYRGDVIESGSLAEMRTFAGGDSYGLGLERYRPGFVRWVPAEGHGGGNIGSTAYMIHLPEHGISMAVGVNEFGTGCASQIVGDVGGVAAWHVEPPPLARIVWSVEGLLGGLWIVGGAGVIVLAIRKNQHVPLLAFGILAVIGGWVMSGKGLPLHHVLWPEGGLLLALGAYRIVRRQRLRSRKGRGESR